MNPEKVIKELNPLDIIMFHVGGIGGYGPIDDIINKFAQDAVVVCFEANSSENDRLVQEHYSTRGVRTFLVPKCVGDIQGKQHFYINKYPASSSLFPPAPQALQEHVLFKHYNISGEFCDITTWGENCELDHIEEVDTVTIDSMVRENILPAPDVLSLDAQGAELRIMRGGEHCVTESVLGIVSEIEFFEIYQGQDLFCAQMDFLSEHGFRLADLFSTQYWHPAPAAGQGFLTVGEALFFRDAEKYISKFQNSDSNILLYKLMKLAAIAYAFRRFSYSSKIATLILEKYGDEAKSLFLSNKSYKPILDMQQYMQRNHHKYLKDNKFFYRGEWEYRPVVLKGKKVALKGKQVLNTAYYAIRNPGKIPRYAKRKIHQLLFRKVPATGE